MPSCPTPANPSRFPRAPDPLRTVSSSSELGVGAFELRLHIANRVGDGGPRSAHHLREVIADRYAVELHLTQGAHDLPHIHVAAVHKGFHEVRDWRAHVAEVDLPELSHFAEVANGAYHIHARQLTAFQPGSTA